MPAAAARDIDGRRHAIAHLPAVNAPTHFGDFPGQFVAEDAREFAEGLPTGQQM
jgi:hypothetical protein